MTFNRITTLEQARNLSNELPDVIAIDTEYRAGDPRFTELLCVIIADGERAWQFPPTLLQALSSVIQSRKIIFLQDYNHCDTVMLLRHGCDLRQANVINTIDLHHLIDETADHSLDARCQQVFKDDYKALFWNQHDKFEDASTEAQLEYSCKDAIYTYRLGMSDLRHIGDNVQLLDLLGHTRKLSLALLDTELNGIKVDTELMPKIETQVKQTIDDCLVTLRGEFEDYCQVYELEKWQQELSTLKTQSGRAKRPRPTFSFESDRQVAWLMYEALGLPVIAETPAGNPKVDYDTLAQLERDFPIVRNIVKYKSDKALYATFIKGMIERVNNGRIYPNFNVSGTKTGRISHSNPNMGNLPKDGPIRGFFLPDNGCVIIGADYAQLEVVVELNLTEDPGLKEIVLGGASKHDLFKADLDRAGFNIPRAQVKNINFALQYGAGAGKISKMVGCLQSEADQIIATFYTRFSGVKTLKDRTNKLLSAQGFVTNLAGRTRRFPAAKNKYDLFRQQRQAYNFLIQGVAAEACNRAYYRFHNWLKTNADGSGMFTVHDEIVAQVYAHDPQRPYFLMEELKNTMEQSSKDFNFKYPLKASTYGPLDRWAKT